MTVRPHLCLATPCFGGTVTIGYLTGVLRLVEACRERGVALSFVLRGGDSLITRCRNSIVAEFLATPGYTHLMWVDADLGFTPEAVLRLLDSGHPVAAGVYPFKHLAPGQDGQPQGLRYSFNPLPGGLVPRPDGFAAVRDVPCGFMLIRREAIETLVRALPELRYVPDRMPGLEHLEAATSGFHYRLFDTMIDDPAPDPTGPDAAGPGRAGGEEAGRFLSEGHAFCRRWQRCGGTVLVDLHSRLSHSGEHVFQGDLLAALASVSAT